MDAIYDEIVCVLQRAASLYVPVHYKNYYKFWWNEELKLLKEYSVDNDKVWKAAGKPRQGPIFDKRQSSRMRYRQCLRQRQCMETTVYTNELHESLLKNEGAAFWKSWRSKFESTSKCTVVEGCSDQGVIAFNFATHLSGCFTGNNRVETLKWSISK